MRERGEYQAEFLHMRELEIGYNVSFQSHKICKRNCYKLLLPMTLESAQKIVNLCKILLTPKQHITSLFMERQEKRYN